MLSEVSNVRQVAGQGIRRWFTDDNFDLIVWYGEQADPAGFQLCYDKASHERALTWTREHGYQHNRVDTGEVAGHSKMSPVIVADGSFERAPVMTRFRQASMAIDPGVASFVIEKLSSYPA